MFKSRIIFIVILFLLIGSPSGNSQQTQEAKTILIIFGLAPNQPAYIPLLNGIREKLDQENKEIINHIQSSAHKLDEIIKDLNTIIDIRHTTFENRQKIDLAHEVNEVQKVFQKELEEWRVESGELKVGSEGLDKEFALLAEEPVHHAPGFGESQR